MFQKNSITLITSFFLAFFGLSQDLEKDFEQIVQKMDSARSIMIDVSVKAYNRKGGQAIYSTKASVIKMEESSKSILGELEILMTPEYDLKIDHEEKAILILKKQDVSKQDLPNFDDLDMKKLRKYFESDESDVKPKIKLISNEGGIKKYSITNVPDIFEMQIHLNSKTNKLLKLSYEYGNSNSKGQYVVLNYSKFDYDLDQSKEFDLTNYFTIDGGEYVLNKRLVGYKIFTER